MVHNGKASGKVDSEEGDKSADSDVKWKDKAIKHMSIKIDRIKEERKDSKIKKHHKEKSKTTKRSLRSRTNDVVTISDSSEDEKENSDGHSEEDVETTSSVRRTRKNDHESVNGGVDKGIKSKPSKSKDKTRKEKPKEQSNRKSRHKSSVEERSSDGASSDESETAIFNMIKQKLHEDETNNKSHKSTASPSENEDGASSDDDSTKAQSSSRKRRKKEDKQSRSSSRHSSVATAERLKDVSVDLDEDKSDPKLHVLPKILLSRLDDETVRSSKDVTGKDASKIITKSGRMKMTKSVRRRSPIKSDSDDEKVEPVRKLFRKEKEKLNERSKKSSGDSDSEIEDRKTEKRRGKSKHMRKSKARSPVSSDSEDEKVEPVRKITRNVKGKSKNYKEDSESSDEEVSKVEQKRKTKKTKKKASKRSSDDSDEDSDIKRSKSHKKARAEKSSGDSESDIEDKKTERRRGKKKNLRKSRARYSSDDSDSESEDDQRRSRSSKGRSRKGRYRESSSSDSDDRSKRRRKSRRNASESESSEEDKGRRRRREKRTAKKKRRRSTSDSEFSDSSTDWVKKKSKKKRSSKQSKKKKKKKKRKESTSESSEREIFASSDDVMSSDDEAKSKKKKKPVKSKKEKEETQKADESSEEEIIAPSKRMKQIEASSESEAAEVKQTKKSSRVKVIQKDSDDDEPVRRKRIIHHSSEEEEEIHQPTKKRKVDSESEEDRDNEGNEERGSSEEGSSEDENTHGRKNIRKIMKQKTISKSTKRAELQEKLRKERIVARQKHYNEWIIQETGTNDVPITTQMILERKEETDEVIVEVSKKLIRNLKPHQVEAVQFMWNCLIESVEQYKKDSTGSGCILAHCMGLGKTLSVITITHTLLTSSVFDLSRLLIICPLNTVLNWRNEWKMWITKKDGFLDLYDVTAGSCETGERVKVIRKWHRNGGVLILGYDMFRNLALGNRIRNKKTKAELEKYLLDPGPDIVVCDEGHLMKNPESSLSKVVNRIKSRRRIVLTGTPLQNNLKEYYTMVSFVKPNLLGSKNEFANRFVNPIMNGQHSNSTQYDVKLMKKRAHILYKTLDGCVHRRDYSALTKYLPPKYEYIIYVRLSECQRNFYSQYLSHIGADSMFEMGSSFQTNKALFNNQQVLYRVWTHPYCLKIHEVRSILSARNFLDDEEDDFISYGTESKSEESNSSGNEAPSKRRKKSNLKDTSESSENSASNSDDDDDDDDDDDGVKVKGKEVVRKWGTKSRGIPRNLDDSDDGDQEKEGTSAHSRPPPSPVNTEWWHELYQEEFQNQIELSGKMELLMHLLRMCSDIGDKTIIFSQSLISLDLIEHFLDKVDEQNQTEKNDEKSEEAKKFGFSFLDETDVMMDNDGDEMKEKSKVDEAKDDSEVKDTKTNGRKETDEKRPSDLNSSSDVEDSKTEEEKNSKSLKSSKTIQSDGESKKAENSECRENDNDSTKANGESLLSTEDVATVENGETEDENKSASDKHGTDKTLSENAAGDVPEDNMETNDTEESSSKEAEKESDEKASNDASESTVKDADKENSDNNIQETVDSANESSKAISKENNSISDKEGSPKENEETQAAPVLPSVMGDIDVASQIPLDSAAAKVCGLQGFESQLGYNSWVKGLDYHRLDGSTSVQARKQMAESFNDVLDNRMRLFLISTKAGGLGINLVAANRVVIFDVSWNPSHDIQSIFRTYRFGQTKPVYVYRLISQGTMEEKIYNRQVAKQSLSSRVIDEMQIERHYTESDLADLYNFTPDIYDPNNPPTEKPALPRDRLLADLIDDYPNLIQKYHVHDSLLEDKGDEDLTEEELKEAWQEFEMEKKRGIRIHPGRPPVSNYLSEAEIAERQTLHFAQALCQMHPQLYGMMRDRVCMVKPHLTQQPINLCRMTNSYVLSVLKMNPVQFAHEYGRWMQEQQQQRYLQQLITQQQQITQQLQQQQQLPPSLVQQLQQQQMLLQQQHQELVQQQQSQSQQQSSQAQQSRLPTLNNPIIIDGDD